MKRMNIKWLFLLLGVASAYAFTSCEDDEKGMPTITSVRITDPEMKDSTFSRAFPGALIVVEGNNLSGLRSVEFNGYEVPFNPNYVLNTSVIVQIPANLPFKGENPELPNTIVLVTSGGRASYDFTFLAPEPEISIFKFAPPAQVGSTMEIIGSNFYVVDKIVFTIDDVVTAEVTDFTVNETHDVISFTIPTGGDQDGEITVVTESGEFTADYLSDPSPEFLKLSDDIQIAGAPITISGKYFAFVDRVEFPGNIQVAKEDLTFNSLFTEITLIVPEGITGSGKIKLLTEFDPEGVDPVESPIDFNDRSGIIRNFEPEPDNIGTDWRKGTDETANGVKPPYVGMGTYHHFLNTIDPNITWWWDPLTLAISPGTWPAITGVTDETPTNKIGLAFNYFTVNPWEKGNWKIEWGGSGKTNVYEFKPWASAPVPKERWVTYTIPLSDLITSTGETTWGQVKAAFNPAESILFMQFQNPNNDNPVEVNAFWDNVRLVKLP